MTDASNGMTAGAENSGGLNLQLTQDGGTTWIANAAQNLEFAFSPTTASGAGINSVKATLSYKTSANPGASTRFWLLASVDGGATWKYYALPAGATTTKTSTVDLSSLVDTPTKLQNLKLRFYVEWGNNISINNDIVQLQVN